jgi:lipoate-protein ligase A
MLKIIDGKPKGAQENMDQDSELLEGITDKSSPMLHFYKWQRPSITYGYFVKVHTLIDLEKIKKFNIDIGKRPTGGGIVFHMWDMAFSFLMPSNNINFSLNPLENYQFVNGIVFKSILEFLKEEDERVSLMEKEANKDNVAEKFCMGHPTKYDVLINNKKVVGAAQRRKKNGYLHQGTISLFMPDLKLLKEILLKDVSEIISSSSFPLIEANENALRVEKKLQDVLIKNFQKTLC